MTILQDFWNIPETQIIIAGTLRCVQIAAVQDEKTLKQF